MIKDRINSKLKTQMMQIVDDTIVDGNEKGFDLCDDKTHTRISRR